MPTRVAFKGTKATIEYLCDGAGNSAVEKFVESLEKSDRRKIDLLFEYLGNNGVISNPQKFKKLEGSDGIFEFKSFQIRILCFWAPGSGRRLILCLGLFKQKDKHSKADITAAENLKKKFLER